MDAISKMDTPRNQVLVRIGRNVVNFQYLEATIRRMLPTISSQGTLSKFNDNVNATVRKYKKSSLGELSENLLGSMHSRDEWKPLEGIDETSEVQFKIGLKVEQTSKDEAEDRKKLLRLVVERNRLIHRDVLGVNLDSPLECAALTARLDEQNQRIREQLEYLNQVRKVQREAFAELVKFINSEEFVIALNNSGGDVQL